MKKCYLLLFFSLPIIGCGLFHTKSEKYNPYYTKQFTAPLNTILTVNTGDDLFVEGIYIRNEIISLNKEFDGYLPGSMFIPFPVYIEKGDLFLKSISDSWKYYCAKPGTAKASFPGLGSVISDGDCVGIRISTEGSDFEWVVDNSNYNKQTTIWTRNITSTEKEHVTHKILESPFAIKEFKHITFNGHYGGMFHFTYEEWTQNKLVSKDFTFDRSKNGPTIVGIKGKIFNILDADNVKLSYEWVKI